MGGVVNARRHPHSSTLSRPDGVVNYAQERSGTELERSDTPLNRTGTSLNRTTLNCILTPRPQIQNY